MLYKGTITLDLESVNKILRVEHVNESYLTVLSCGGDFFKLQS